MLPAVNLPTLVSPSCPSLPHKFPSATAQQYHQRYHLPTGFVEWYLSHSRSCSPSPSLSPFCPQLPSFTTSRPVFPALSQSLAHPRACPPHPHHCHCHCHRRDSYFKSSALRHPPRSHHHHPRWLSDPTSVVYCPGSRLACTAGSLPADLGPGIIATEPRETLAGGFHLPQAGCLLNRAIDFIRQGMEVVPPPIVH